MEPPAPAANFGRASQRGKHIMPDTHALAERPRESQGQGQLAVYDAIVIGAGISGMYMLYRLRELGMTTRVFEAGRTSAAPGTGTAIPARASIPKAGPMAIPFPGS